jgi:hypothetical protein
LQEKQTIWQPIGAKLLVPAGKGECFCLQLKHKTFCFCLQETCPVHVIGPFLDGVAHGSKVFGGVTAANALSTLRFILVQMGVEQASEYRTHDLRRGHAQDLVESGVVAFGWCFLRDAFCPSGAPLATILAAGEWRSPAFLAYIDQNRLETDVVVAAHQDESDEGES